MSRFLTSADLVKEPISTMLHQLNIGLQKDGAIFRLQPNSALCCIDIVPSSTIWLSDLGSIINVSKEYIEYLKSFFLSAGYTIDFNNNASCFWFIEGGIWKIK